MRIRLWLSKHAYDDERNNVVTYHTKFFIKRWKITIIGAWVKDTPPDYMVNNEMNSNHKQFGGNSENKITVVQISFNVYHINRCCILDPSAYEQYTLHKKLYILRHNFNIIINHCVPLVGLEFNPGQEVCKPHSKDELIFIIFKSSNF